MKTIIIIAGLLVGMNSMAGGMSGDAFEAKRTPVKKEEARDPSSEKIVADEAKSEPKEEPTVEKRRPFHHTGALENAR